MKKALILAAGIGKRLGDLTKDIPKCLLKIDSERCLIDFSLEALVENGIKEITFVTGFREDKLKTHVLEKWAGKSDFNFIYNEKYEEYNNIYSAYLAKDIWDDATVLLNSDIIFDPEILKNLKEKISSRHCEEQSDEAISKTIEGLPRRHNVPPRNDNEPKSYLVIDDTKKLIGEDMKVEINAKGEIKKISKKLNNETSYGEYIGITYLRGFERVKFIESLEENVKKKKLDIYYEDALGCVLNEISVFSYSTEGKSWTEIDTKEDYEVAKSIIKKMKMSEECCGEQYSESRR